jgi:hypothetical protein
MPKKTIATFFLLLFVFNFFGCGESFRKKFIRKPKYEPKQEEMIITPKDYSKQSLPSDELYKTYYSYWKAWHLELEDVFIPGQSKKKIISCFDQVILNLNRLKGLLNNQEKIALLDSYINKLYSQEEIFKVGNIAVVSMYRARDEARRLFINIQRDFSFSKVKDYLKA